MRDTAIRTPACRQGRSQIANRIKKLYPIRYTLYATRGFTLIELLIVIAVIGVLIAVGIQTFSGAQQRARDAKRRADLDSIAKAVQFYKNDNGAAPAALPAGGTAWLPYMNLVPQDPLTGQTKCGGLVCNYTYTTNMWCNPPFAGPNCSSNVTNIYTPLESCTNDDQSGDGKKAFNYGCPYYMKIIP